MATRLARAAIALALIPLVSGCVAVLAIPLVAGGTLYARDKIRVRAATPRPPESAATATRLAITELPPPSALSPEAALAHDRWQAFFDYALSKSRKDAGGNVQSALLVGGAPMTRPNRLPCRTTFPAVVVDLDQGKTPFAPDQAVSADPELKAGLAQLRAAGMTVLWITQLPSAQAGAVSNALKASDLDPDGMDPLLLIRSPDDRKQVLRQEANNDVCVVAVAGDRRADFDELFDYLLDPAAAAGLSPMIGAGWFLTPAPIPVPGAPTDSSQSLDAQEGE